MGLERVKQSPASSMPSACYWPVHGLSVTLSCMPSGEGNPNGFALQEGWYELIRIEAREVQKRRGDPGVSHESRINAGDPDAGA
jgi:hypothetical protein